jgi:hypothetical protein
MRGLIQFLLVIGGVALISAVLHKPLPSDALRRAQVERWPTEQERTRAADAPKLTTFTVTGPSGTPVAAVFYGLERLPRSEEGRLCDLVSAWMRDRSSATRAGPQPSACTHSRLSRATCCSVTRPLADAISAIWASLPIW